MPVINAGAAVAAAERVTGLRVDPFGGFNFLVEIQGLIAAGFSKVGGLSSSTETATVWEGGVNNGPRILPVRTTYDPLVFEKGLTDFDMMWSWYQDVTKGQFKRRNGTIYLLSHLGIPVTYWNFKNAYPSAWTGPQLDAQSNAVAAMSVTLVHEGLTNPLANAVGKAARAVLPGG